VSVTEFGKEFTGLAERLLNDLKINVAHMRRLAETPRGQIVVSSVFSPVTAMLPSLRWRLVRSNAASALRPIPVEAVQYMTFEPSKSAGAQTYQSYCPWGRETVEGHYGTLWRYRNLATSKRRSVVAIQDSDELEGPRSLFASK
jgi:hypothetical protein